MESDLNQFIETLEAIESVELISNQHFLKRPRVYRKRADHFEKYDDRDFFIRYRLSKQSVLFFLEKIEPLLEYWDNRFTSEVTSVLNISMSFQILTATLSTCFVIYNMSITPRMTLQFLFLLALLIVFQFEVFLYCYYGSLVEYEYESVCQSAFHSDWVSVSPWFRRSLLIAMIRWTQPLRNRVSVEIPLAITTSIQMARSAYTLFTLMTKSGN